MSTAYMETSGKAHPDNSFCGGTWVLPPTRPEVGPPTRPQPLAEGLTRSYLFTQDRCNRAGEEHLREDNSPSVLVDAYWLGALGKAFASDTENILEATS